MALGSFFENARKVDLFMLAMPFADPCRSVGFFPRYAVNLCPHSSIVFGSKLNPPWGTSAWMRRLLFRHTTPTHKVCSKAAPTRELETHHARSIVKAVVSSRRYSMHLRLAKNSSMMFWHGSAIHIRTLSCKTCKSCRSSVEIRSPRCSSVAVVEVKQESQEHPH